MTERSIAEIMGWRRCGRCKKHWNLPDDWGSERPINESPNVDDLLAWLMIKGYELGAVVLAHLDRAGHNDLVVCRQHQTLLEALEAAVRAVDQQSSLDTAPAATGDEVEAVPSPAAPTSDAAGHPPAAASPQGVAAATPCTPSRGEPL